MNHTTRTFALKRMLNDRRRELLNDLRSRVRDIPGDRARGGPEALEDADVGAMVNEDAAPARASLEAVARLDDAIGRLDGGKYGSCLDCAREISEQRLSTVPFAVRCQSCEDRRQAELGRPQGVGAA